LLEGIYRLGHQAIRWRHERQPWLWSLRLLQYAADRGHLSAMTEFGALLYCQGACRTEKSTGLDYLRMAARHGIVEAQYQLGISYCLGCFWLEPDRQQAQYWLRLAADQGHVLACNRLNDLLADAEREAAKGDRGSDHDDSPDKLQKKAVCPANVA
jgi:TPR repeat protein